MPIQIYAANDQQGRSIYQLLKRSSRAKIKAQIKLRLPMQIERQCVSQGFPRTKLRSYSGNKNPMNADKNSHPKSPKDFSNLDLFLGPLRSTRWCSRLVVG
ncbi:MAG: hypothetical protein Ct9H90mP27_2420 [Gammaproteobacteria bacterium]|nr:MAG: hypothetical protein Ct9H90mP27_2420 [Gammaproteobacteria bacterium]